MLSATRIGLRYAVTTVSRATLVRRSYVSAFRQGAPTTGTLSSDWALAAAGGVALTLAAVSDARSTTYTSLDSRVPVGDAIISTGSPVTEKATGIAFPQLCNGKVYSAMEGDIEAIVSAMAAHSNMWNVQEYGCLALGNLSRNNDVNCVSIAAKYGIEAIVSAMTTHTNAPKVQDQGCLALFNLCFNESVAARIGVEGGLAVLEHNPSNSDAERALQRIRASINVPSRHLSCELDDLISGRKS